MRSIVVHSAAAFLLGAGACSGYGQPADMGESVPVQGIKVTPQSMQLAIGEARQLSATVAPANATDQTIAWESTDTTVATVDGTGLVTGKGTGAGIFITVVTHDGGYQASSNVTVSP